MVGGFFPSLRIFEPAGGRQLSGSSTSVILRRNSLGVWPSWMSHGARIVALGGYLRPVGCPMASHSTMRPITSTLYHLVDDEIDFGAGLQENHSTGSRITACASPVCPEFISSAAGQNGQALIGDGGWVSRLHTWAAACGRREIM